LHQEDNKMISYNPQVQDRSGEIMANARAQASQTQALAMTNFGDNISKAIASIGAGFQERESKKAKGRAFKSFMEVLGPSIDMDTAKLASISGKDKLKGDLDWYHASEMIAPILPAIVNSTLATGRAGFSAGLRNKADVASGEGTVPLPNNPAPYGGPVVEPPLPVGDPAGAETLPPVATSSPSPDAMSAADSWWKNKSSGSPMQSGSMKPFWR
jgi:hypothetical protein